MELLRGLTESLITVDVCERSLLSSYLKDLHLKPIGVIKPDGMHLCDVHYSAEINIERYIHTPFLLLSLVSAWLQENDPTRTNEQLEDPAFVIDPRGTKSFDIDITIDFVEPIYLVEDAVNGLIDYAGKKWAFGGNNLWVAESFGITR